MGTSNMRDRLSRVTEGAPAQGRRDIRGPQSGGFMRMLRTEHMVEQRPSRGIGSLFGQQQTPIGQQGPRGAGFPGTARDVAGKAGSAFAGAAGIAARAGQSAAWVTRDASSVLAQRMSEASHRMTEHEMEQDQYAAGRHDERSRTPGRERSWTGSARPWESGRAQSGGPGARSWEDQGHGGWRDDRSSWGGRPSPSSWEDQRQHGWEDHGHRGRGPGRRESGFEPAGRALPGRGRAAQGEQRWDSGEPGAPRRGGRPGQRIQGRGPGEFGAQPARGRGRGRATPERAWGGPEQAWQRERPDGPMFGEIRAQGGRGVSKRHMKRIDKAQGMADVAAQRAYEASERAAHHGHSRRARKDERRAVSQADRAQRMLESHLIRAERHMASSKRRRRRSVGMMMLAGAGAGATFAARRLMGQPGGDRQRQGAPSGMSTGAAYPPKGEPRVSETRTTTVTTGPIEERPVRGGTSREGTGMTDTTQRRTF